MIEQHIMEAISGTPEGDVRTQPDLAQNETCQKFSSYMLCIASAQPASSTHYMERCRLEHHKGMRVSSCRSRDTVLLLVLTCHGSSFGCTHERAEVPGLHACRCSTQCGMSSNQCGDVCHARAAGRWKSPYTRP